MEEGEGINRMVCICLILAPHLPKSHRARVLVQKMMTIEDPPWVSGAGIQTCLYH